MTVFVAVLLIAAWVGVIGAFGWYALNAFMPMWGDSKPVRGFMFCVAAVVTLAGGIAVGATKSGPNDNRLCLSGHQEWQSRQGAPVLVGKVIVPGGTYTSKVWVCDRWEAK